MVCLNDENTLDYQINCVFNAYSKNSSDRIKINFDNGQSSFLNLSSQSLNYFGEYVPKSIAQPAQLNITGGFNVFMLLNTEFKVDANLIGFEVYGTATGQIRIHVIFFII